ncbi:hypothetical protein M9458_052324, partial [Cirrhinus mrigala]
WGEVHPLKDFQRLLGLMAASCSSFLCDPIGPASCGLFNIGLKPESHPMHGAWAKFTFWRLEHHLQGASMPLN